MRTGKRNLAICARQPITASKRNFLRVNAQMHNLVKQKTTSACKTLAVMAKDQQTQ